MFEVTIILNTKVMVIEIKYYQLQNILITLDHISFIDNDEEYLMHSKSENIEIMMQMKL